MRSWTIQKRKEEEERDIWEEKNHIRESPNSEDEMVGKQWKIETMNEDCDMEVVCLESASPPLGEKVK